ncbi:MAG TPA: DnaJ domain-containing protein, partial [Burkholderiaceae bacterium]|nr:DnaJ domain-containing protein [Burkholderiaceae bacterium]
MSIDLAYAELGLRPGASEAEVRAAFRRLAARWHPDRNPSPEAVAWMQRINRAYEAIREAAFAGDFGAAAAQSASS